MDAETLAKKFHDTYEALAPSFNYKTRNGGDPLEEVPEDYRNLMVAVCRVVLNDVREQDAGAVIAKYMDRVNRDEQSIASDRNAWQRRLGVLLTTIEGWGQPDLLKGAYDAVNTNPVTGNMDDPYADIARLTVRMTLEPALAAGLVVPGPNAPDWMKAEGAPSAEEE
jgi:hypothetical protein